ncbi:MAG: flavin reductase family protein [Thermoguttaceae bacterium]
MSLEKVQIPSQRPIYPTPAGLVTTVDGEGNPNIITLGEIYNLSIRKPVIVGLGIAPQRYSHQLLCECREFVVNLPTSALLDKVLACGNVSGRDVRDKFARAGLTPLPAQRVKPPLIAECPVNLECRLLDDPEPIGDHDLFKGEVLAEHVDAELIDEEGNLRTERLDMLIFARWTFWTAGKQIAVRG